MSTILSEYSQLIVQTSKYYLTPIFIFGVLGNLANMIVFYQDSLRVNGCSWYFISVSVVNLLVLLAGCLSRLIVIYVNSAVTPVSQLLCKIRTYLIFNGYVLSRHFLCIISIDRWMVTSQRVYFRNRSNPRMARRVIIISKIIWFSINIFIPIGFETDGGGCVPKSDTFYLPMYTIVNLIATLIPFIILILFSFLTVRNIFRSKNRANRKNSVHPEIGVPNRRLTTVSNLTVSHNRNKEWQLIRLCLIQVTAFLLFNNSNTGYTLYQFITKTNGKSIEQQIIDIFFQSIGNDLVYTQCAITFYLYTLASKEFRKVCLTICRRVQGRVVAVFH